MADLSRGTVDRVIHNRGVVSLETRKKIEDIINEYDYKPNPIGRALSNKNPYKIGVILIQEYVPFFQIVKEAVLKTAEQYKDYGIEVILKHLPWLDEEDYLNALEELEKEVNAFALIGYNTPKIIEKVNTIVTNGTPLVTMNVDIFVSLRKTYVGINNYQGGQCLAQLVNDKSHGNIKLLLLAGHSDNKLEKERLDGFLIVIDNTIDHSNVIYTQDQPLKVYEIVYNQLKENEYDAIVTLGYGTHIICKVIDNLQLKKKPLVYGIDLLAETKKYLKEGKNAYIVDQSAYLQGQMAMVYLCEHFIHNTPIPKGNIYLPISIYNRYNLD